MTDLDLLAAIRAAVNAEAEALRHLAGHVDSRAVQAVRCLMAARGRVVVTGMGKAGLVGRKIAATLASTGTPALFLHPAEALHGDLGMVAEGDVVLALSKSGETEEVLRLLPHLKALGVCLVALTCDASSSLAREADLTLDVGVVREADPLGVVPTASTTAFLALGDALASALVALRGFGADQFATLHPGGTLGRRLLLKVGDLMHTGEQVPRVGRQVRLREAIPVMSSKGLGAVFVEGEDQALEGIFCDGDLRRLLQRVSNPLDLDMARVMTHSPRTTHAHTPAMAALRLMEDCAITVLPVVGTNLTLEGAIHLHDLIRAGLAPVATPAR